MRKTKKMFEVRISSIMGSTCYHNVRWYSVIEALKDIMSNPKGLNFMLRYSPKFLRIEVEQIKYIKPKSVEEVCGKIKLPKGLTVQMLMDKVRCR